MATIRYRVPSVSIVGTTAPAWFSALAERTWTDIAGGSTYSGADWQKGNRLIDVAPSPNPPGDTGMVGIITAYCGATSMQSTGEYLKVAEGGHADYYGNEIYALKLTDATPGWKRIWGPTPNAQMSTSSISQNQAFVRNLDNTPRSCHGWYNRVTTADRMWTFLTNAGPTGSATTDVWSIARAGLDTGVYDPALWTYHGRWYTGALSSEVQLQAVPTCWDEAGGQIFVAPEADVRSTGTGTLGTFINVATCLAAGQQASTGPQVPGSTSYLATAGNPLTGMSQAWSVVATNASPRCLIALRSGQISVWNLESPSVWRHKTVSGGSLPSAGSANAYYSAANRKIVLGGATISTLQTLSIPSDPWNASTGFNMGTIAIAGGSLSAIIGAGFTNSQFQVIGNMGNGQACAVLHCRNLSSPTYVYKLPVTF